MGPNARPVQMDKYCVFGERAKTKKKMLFFNFKMESLPWDFSAFEVFFPRLLELLR